MGAGSAERIEADVKRGLTEQILLDRSSTGDTARAGAERDADTLIALLDGLILNIVAGLHTAESATEILRAQLDHVFRGRPRRSR